MLNEIFKFNIIWIIIIYPPVQHLKHIAIDPHDFTNFLSIFSAICLQFDALLYTMNQNRAERKRVKQYLICQSDSALKSRKYSTVIHAIHFRFWENEIYENVRLWIFKIWSLSVVVTTVTRCRAIRDMVIYISFRSNIWSALVPTAWSWRGNLSRGRGHFGSIETKEAAVWKFAQHSGQRSDPRINARRWTSQLNSQSAGNSTSWFPLSITA